MKALKFVEPQYEIPTHKTLYTKNLTEGRRIDIRVYPLNPCDGTTLPYDIDFAFESVIWADTKLSEETITAQVMKDWMKKETFGEMEPLAMEAVRYDMLQNFQEVQDDERTGYICPVVSKSGVGYREGYVIGWGETDVHDVAEYLAGGRAEIECCLIDEDVPMPLNSTWLGELSYSDITCDTDQYRRIVEGENLILAQELLEGVEPGEPDDPEYPGAEILATFAKLP